MKCTVCGAENYGLHHSASCKYCNVDIYERADKLQAEIELYRKALQHIYNCENGFDICPDCKYELEQALKARQNDE